MSILNFNDGIDIDVSHYCKFWDKIFREVYLTEVSIYFQPFFLSYSFIICSVWKRENCHSLSQIELNLNVLRICCDIYISFSCQIDGPKKFLASPALFCL